MNSQTVEITSAGIRKILNKYTPERAIAEYVWNGFDAKATVVNIDFEIDNSREFDISKLEKVLTVINDNFADLNIKLSDEFKRASDNKRKQLL